MLKLTAAASLLKVTLYQHAGDRPPDPIHRLDLRHHQLADGAGSLPSTRAMMS